MRVITTAILIILVMMGAWYFCPKAQADEIAINPMHKAIAEKFVIRTLQISGWKAPKIRLVDHAELAMPSDRINPLTGKVRDDVVLHSRWSIYDHKNHVVLMSKKEVSRLYAENNIHQLIAELVHEFSHDVDFQKRGYEITDDMPEIDRERVRHLTEFRAKRAGDEYLISNGIVPQR